MNLRLKKLHDFLSTDSKGGQFFGGGLIYQIANHYNFSNVKMNKRVIKEYSSWQNKKINVSQQILASPVVFLYAKTLNVDLRLVKGSGKRSRILKQDIIFYLQNKTKQISEPIQQQKILNHSYYGEQSIISMTPFQQLIQKQASKGLKIPHLYLHQKFDITQLIKMATQLKITQFSILIKILSLALKKQNKLNSLYHDTIPYQYQTHHHHHFSIAIPSPSDFVYPTIKNVETLTFSQIQSKIVSLQQSNNQGLFGGGTHLNLGTFFIYDMTKLAGKSMCPLILGNYVTTIAVGRITQQHKSGENRSVTTISFGCDHRVIDGARVAKFSNIWKKLVEQPYLAFQQMV